MKIFQMAIFSFCTASLSPDWEILSNTLKVAQQTGKLSDETEVEISAWLRMARRLGNDLEFNFG